MSRRPKPAPEPTDTWLSPPMWFTGDLPDPRTLRYHFYAVGSKESACMNYHRPFMSFVAGEGCTACPRCLEAFTLNGKAAPRFP